MKINYLIIDEFGIEKKKYISNIVATSDVADDLFVFADFDPDSNETSFRVSARIKRADGFIIGPIRLDTTTVSPELAEEIGLDYVACRKLTFTDEMLALEGFIEITIVYETIDSEGKVLKTKATSRVVVRVLEAVETVATQDEIDYLLGLFMPRDLSEIPPLIQAQIDDAVMILGQKDGTTSRFSVEILRHFLERHTIIDLGNHPNLDEIVDKGIYRTLVYDDGQTTAPLILMVDDNGNQFILTASGLIGFRLYNNGTDQFKSWRRFSLFNLETRMTASESEIDKIKDGVLVVERALKDDEGNVIKETYETKTHAASEIGKIVSGATVAAEAIKATKDANNLDIHTTYVKRDGSLKMTGQLDMDNNRIKHVGTATEDNEGVNKGQVVSKIASHNASQVAHLYIRELIQTLEQEIARLDAKGRSYGEIDKKQSELLALDEVSRNAYILSFLQNKYTGYTVKNGDLIYTKTSVGENEHEWEYNSTISNWVDNGAYLSEKASNSEFGIVKGNDYISFVSGLAQVLKADYATLLGDSGASLDYTALKTTLNELEALKNAENIEFVEGVSVKEELERLEADKAEKSALTDIEASIDNVQNEIEAKAKGLQLENVKLQQEVEALTQSLRKVERGDTEVVESGEEIIHLENNVNGNISFEIEGFTLYAPQAIKDNKFENIINGIPESWECNKAAGDFFRSDNSTFIETAASIEAIYTQQLRDYWIDEEKISKKWYFNIKIKEHYYVRGELQFGLSDGIGNKRYNAVSESLGEGWHNFSGVISNFIPDKIFISTTEGAIFKFEIASFDVIDMDNIPIENLDKTRKQMDTWLEEGTIPNVKIKGVEGNKLIKVGSDNLLKPDLRGKTESYLGKGWYLLYNDGGGHIAYNIFTGVYELNVINEDTFIDGGGMVELFDIYNLRIDENYTITKVDVSAAIPTAGSVYLNDVFKTITLGDGSGGIKKTRTFVPDFEKTSLYFVYNSTVGLINKYQFKLMLNIGDSYKNWANPYHDYSQLYLRAPTLNSLKDIKDKVFYLNGKVYLEQNVGKSEENLSNEEIFLDGENSYTYNFKITKKYNDMKTDVLSNFSTKALLNFGNDNFPHIATPTTPIEHFYFSSSHFFIYIEKNKISSFSGASEVEKFKSYLDANPMLLLYELQASEEKEVASSGLLQAFSNGIVFFENKKKEIYQYTDKVVAEKDIKELDNLYKINFDGTTTQLRTSVAVITNNEFTHPDLVENDFVFFVYEYENNKLFGKTTITYNKQTAISNLQLTSDNIQSQLTDLTERVEMVESLSTIILGVIDEPQSNGELTRYTGFGSYPINVVEENDGDFVYYKWNEDYWPFNMISEVIDSNNNVFIKIPKMYIKYVYDELGVLNERYISNMKLSGYDLPKCFVDPETGKELPFVLVGKYDGANDNDVLVSKSNQTVQVSTTLADSRTRAEANGIGNHLFDFHVKHMIETLYLIVFANHQSDTMFPQGVDGNIQKTGILDSMTHHTGYTKGLANYLMKFLGIENYFSNVYTQVDGIKIVDREVFVSDDYRNYNSSATDTNGYELIAETPKANGYIVALGNKGVPKERSSSSGTFYKNYLYQNTGYCTLYFGRCWSVSAYFGLFHWPGDGTLDYAASYSGVRLVKKPTS